MIPLYKSKDGFSLVEIMIALLIMAVGFSVTLRVLPDSNRITIRARNISKATNLAQEKVEQLQGLRYTDPALNVGTHQDANNPIEKHFSRSWHVKRNSPLAGMKTVRVKVNFPTEAADSSVTLEFVVSKRL